MLRFLSHRRFELNFGLATAAVILLALSLRRWLLLRRETRERTASEQRLAALFAASPFPVGLFSVADGRVLDANDIAIRAAGVDREALIGRAIVDLPFWDRAAAELLLEKVRAQGAVRNLEIRTSRGDDIRPVLVSAHTIEVDGEPCFLAAMSDISTQRRAEREREASVAELRSVFQAMRDVVIVLSRDGKYLKIPATNSDLLNREYEELLGKNIRDVLPAELAATCIGVIGQALDEQRAVLTEYALDTRGRPVWFAATVTPLDRESVVWVARDITDERLARERLATSEAQYRLLFARNPQPMWVIGHDSRFLDVNDAALAHYGYSRDEFLALSPEEIRPPEEVEGYRRAMRSEWPVSEPRVFHHRKRNGDIIEVEISRDDIVYHGTPARLILAHDVTARQQVARKLEASLSLQRATLDATADGIVAFDAHGVMTSWNGKFADLVGVTGDSEDHDAVARAFGAMMSAAREHRDEAFKAQTSPPGQADTMIRLDVADGRIIERYERPQRLDGGVVGVVCSFRDVTQRERAAAQRQLLADRFQSAFGDAPIGMTIMTADGCWLQVNRAMCEMLGRTEDELLGRRSEAITHEDDRAKTAHELGRLRADERSVRFEKRYRHAGGRDISTVVNATLLRGRGAADLIISHVVDVTEQREAERATRRQAMVFGTIADAVIICTPDGRIIDANEAAATILGYSRQELIGQTPRLWQREDVGPQVYQSIAEALRSDGRWSGEYGFVTRDGRIGILESTVRILRDADGNPRNSIGVFRDVTERREMARQLLQAQKLEAIGSLAAGIAHEINTPAQYVGDNVRFLDDGIGALREVLSEARELATAARGQAGLEAAVASFDARAFEADLEYLLTELPVAAQQSREGCERISDIVKAMKGFSHPGGSQKQFFDLNGAVRDTATVCRNEWKYVAELTTDFDDSMPLVPCLPGELQQVVLNLIVNAAHAIAEARGDSGELGHITVTTHHDDDWAEIRVRDDGCGIPDSIRAKVFDPFFTTKKVGTGTGQGLAICHATIVRKHGGTLTFDSVPGEGTTFVIRLPLDASPSMTQAA